MKTIIHEDHPSHAKTSNSRPLRRALCTFLLGIAALWAMPRSAHAQPFYGNVGEYDATTGAAINANFITGLSRTPQALAVSGNNLFVSNAGPTVGEYNATTGATMNANFITGLNKPVRIAVSGNNLFVLNYGGGGGYTVSEYNATTGAAINANFISTGGHFYFPTGLAVSGNDLFVSNFSTEELGEYDVATGAAINANFITGLSDPVGLAVSGNKLFVTDFDFAPVPEPSTWSMIAMGGVALLGITHRKKQRT